jgi:hypothetical protein
MYMQEIKNILQSHEVKIKYDCNGGYENCGQEKMLKLRYAEKNIRDNDGKHICRNCQLKNNNPMKNKEVQAKVKRTCMERYGSTLPINSQDNIEKRREKFQDEEYKRKWVEKHKQTSLERYGVEHPMLTEAVREKQKQTMQEKYGVDHPYQSPEIMAKMKANNMQKYGVEYVAQLPEVIIKMAQTTLQRYGVEHYNQLPEMKNYLRENCRDWLAESYASGGPNKGVPRPEEWNQKQSETMTEKILRGEFNGGGNHSIKGRYNSQKCLKKLVIFRSSFELKFHLHLDKSDDVLNYDYEPFQIPYHDTEGKLRHYIVDFIVKYKNGQIVCVEIKNNYNKQEYLEGDKYQQIKKLCEENNMSLKILANKEVDELNISLDDVLNNSEIITLFNSK